MSPARRSRRRRTACRRTRSSPAIRSRSSTRPARPACPRASAARTRSISGGRVYTGELIGVGDSDVLMTTLPMFHTNALERFLPGPVERSDAHRRAALFRVAASCRRWRGTTRPSPTCSAPWCRCCWRSPRARPTARTGYACALAPAVPAHFHAQFTGRFGFGLLDGYGSTETNCVMGAPLAEQRPGMMGRLLAGFYRPRRRRSGQ